MKKYLPIAFLVIFCALEARAQSGTYYSGNSVKTEQNSTHVLSDPSNFPGNIKAFLENKGQFVNTVNDWKVLYGCDYQGTRILFTDKGVIYVIPQLVKVEGEKDKYKNPEEENEHTRKTIFNTVSIAWENANTELNIEPIGKRTDQFGSIDPVNMGKSIDNINGFQKLVYHDVYPGIDIEYTFHSKQGIKYAVKIKPGYSLTQFKMLYTGQSGLHQDEQGNIHIETPVGDIIDHAPVSFQDKKKVESSFKKISDNEISFVIKNRNSNTDLIIDPWTVSPTTGTFVPDRVHMDAANNVYILGSYAAGGFNTEIIMYEQKYTSAGTLAWTYTYNQLNSTSFLYGPNNLESDLAVDPAGNSYVAGPLYYQNANSQWYAMVSLNTNMGLNYFYNTYNAKTVFEVWNLAFNCANTTLIQAGAGPAAQQGEVSIVNATNGNLGGVYNAAAGSDPSEIYTGCIAPNGLYYGLSSDLEFNGNIPNDQLFCWNIAGAAPAVLWNVNTGYSFDDYEVKSPYGDGDNNIAAGCAYLYTMDGLVLEQRSLTTGAVINSVNVPGGNNGHAGEDDKAPGKDNSGIAVDLACGYVYVGTKGSVQVYDQNLNSITSQPMPAGGIVYGVTFNNGLVSACGATLAGAGFVAQFQAQTCPALTITHVSTTCGLPNGIANLATPTFCAAPYNYTWSNGATTQNVTGLAAGTYTVNVGTQTNCATESDTVIIGPSSAETVTATPTGGGCSGGASTTVTGGTPAYAYSWSNGATTSNITGVAAGNYTVTVTDAESCVETATVTVSGTPLNVSGTPVNVTCPGGADGSASVTVTGGTSPYTYSWNTGQTTSSITGIGAGSYTCTVNDAGTCSGSATITITQPNPIVVDTTSSPATCTGATGSAGVTSVTGGTGPYTYSWNGGQTTSTINNLTAGNYTVTVKDANGCTHPSIVTVGSTGATIIPIATETNVLCNGKSTGTATVTGSTGGTAPYTYTWSGGQTTTTVNALPAGTYTVTSKDNTGCVGQTTVTITQPTPLQLSSSAVGVSCHGECNGQLISLPSGGTGPYTYTWSNGVTSASESNVCPATYSIVVKDANGCTIDSTGLVVSQPTAITGTTTTTPAQCNQADGGACVTASGGTGAYTYSWNTGITTTCISNVLGGPYSVIITDANNCKDTVKVTVPNIAADTVIITATKNVSCFGGSDGSITSQASGGVAPYTYAWSTNPVQTTPVATNLIAGTYTVSVKDGSPGGCPVIAVATITQPAVVVPTAPAPQTICIGDSAKLTVTAVGGTPPYTFTWMPGNLTGSTVTVRPGTTTTYTILTVDANNCLGAPVQVVITVNPPLKVTVTPNRATCPGGSKSIGATASGGDGVYSYTWTPATGLSCSTCATTAVTPTATTQYTVVVHDNCGTPPVKDSVVVTVDPLPNVKFVADTLAGCPILCVNFTDSTTIAWGGLASWYWTFGDSSTSAKQDPRHCYNNPGVYTVSLKVVSDSGCPDSLTIPKMITVYSVPVAAFTATPQPATIISPQITFTDQSTDIYGIATWFWQFEDPLDRTSTIQNPQYTYADTGTYCPKLKVTNKHGCVDSVQHCIIIDPYFTLYIPNAFTPNSDGLNEVFNVKGTYICGFKMYIFDRWGMQLYYTEDLNKGWDGRVNGGANIAQEDTYVYLIEATDCISHSKHQYIGRVTIIK